MLKMTFCIVAGHCYQLVSHDKHEIDGLDEGESQFFWVPDIVSKLFATAILTADYKGEPLDSQKGPLDPENISLDDHPLLDGLIIDNVRGQSL